MYDSEEDDEFFVMLDQEGRVYGYSEGFDFSTRSCAPFGTPATLLQLRRLLLSDPPPFLRRRE